MLLTTKVSLKKIKSDKLLIIKEMTKNSKDLYNKGLYNIRQQFFKDKSYLSYGKNDKLTKTQWNETETSQEYYNLQSNCSQQILKKLDKNFKSFFKLLKMKNNGKFNEKVNIPKYLGKDEHNIVIFSKSSFKILGNYIRLSTPVYIQKRLKSENKDPYLNFKIPKNIIDKNNIQEVHILPNKSGTKFTLIFIYKNKEVNLKKDNGNYLSLDLGVDNIVSMVNSNSGESILINGKEIKSINRFINKNKSVLSSILKLNQNKHYSKRLDNLDTKRLNILKDRLHKISTYIIDYCLNNNINNIVIGINEGWKNEINIGKKNNQNFLNIPHSLLIQYIEYKSKLSGLNCILQEESYTSKVDSLVLEDLPVYGEYSDKEISKTINPLTNIKYLGKRIKRGLFQSSSGKLIHSDINGSLNILRKYLNSLDICKQDSLIKKILSSGRVFRPIKISIV